MNKPSYLLKNCHIVTFNSSDNKVIQEKTNLGILNGRIHQIGDCDHELYEKSIDLNGLTALPGVIDSQVHFREPGLTHKEDIESGSKAALLGGVTTFFEMPNTNPATTTAELFYDKLKRSENRAHTNYAYFIGASAENISKLAQLEKLPHCSGIKLFLGSSFGDLLIDQDEVFEQIIRSGHRRLVIHSEDEARLKTRKQIAIDSGHPKDHHVWRDEESALISTKKSIHLAEKHNRPVHILHVSSSEEMAFLKEHKNIATVETLPQYLVMSAPECYERLGTFAQQNPPIRDKRHLEYLWKALLNGTVDVIGSDHAPHTIEEKNKPYPQSPSGVPGVQTLVPVMLNEVSKQNLSIEKFVELVTENPRRIFGLKNKGRIEVGYDADITVVDLKRTEVIQKNWLASKVGWSPFENCSVTGWPIMSFINGELCMQNSEILKAHSGQACEFKS